mgnify:CR=1 FL=1|tara:strand:- start:208 stop:417 length:210 start_codon:yes stop_codon:yes gene_type:complete
MINTSQPINPPSEELCNFIIDRFGINDSEIEMGIKRSKLENSPLPVVMWSYGLLNLDQLEIILSWQTEY